MSFLYLLWLGRASLQHGVLRVVKLLLCQLVSPSCLSSYTAHPAPGEGAEIHLSTGGKLINLGYILSTIIYKAYDIVSGTY